MLLARYCFVTVLPFIIMFVNVNVSYVLYTIVQKLNENKKKPKKTLRSILMSDDLGNLS